MGNKASEILTISLKKGDVLIHEHAKSQNIYWVKEGFLAAYKQKGTEEIELAKIQEGEIVGEMSFLDNSPRCATVKALSNCELIEIPLEKYEEVLASLPKWFQSLMNTLAIRLRNTNTKIKI